MKSNTEHSPTAEDEVNPYVRLCEGDPERIVRLAKVLQPSSLGRVYKNLVVHRALDVLERDLGIEPQSTNQTVTPA